MKLHLILVPLALVLGYAGSPTDVSHTPEGTAQFDFMLGEWESTSHWMEADQSLREVKAHHRFSRAFGGQGVVDDNFKRADGDETYWGTAIRTYDPQADAWTCRWYDGEQRSWASEFVLRREGDRIVGEMKGSDQHGAYTDRIQFDPADEDTVNWTMVRRYAGLPQPMTIGRIDYRRVSSRSEER